jgi:hypothetical protein
MRNVWMLLLTLTISTFWIHVPHKGEIGFFLNPEVTLSYNQWVWLFCQNLIYVVQAGVIWDESRRWHLRPEEQRQMLTRIYSGYLWILMADCFLWVLTYDDPLKDYRITWNILKTVIFIGVIVYELKRREHGKHRH